MNKIRCHKLARFETLEPRRLLTNDLMITEFMARNSSVLADQDGDFSDWVEIYNPTDEEINLSNWHLSDNAAVPNKWTLPDQNLSPNNFVTIFASSKNRAVPASELHTNFKISSAGEELTLAKTDPTSPSGYQVVSEFNVAFPHQQPDVSYGVSQDVSIQTLVSATDVAKIFFPTDNLLGTSWSNEEFDDTPWLTGSNAIGYQRTVPGFTVHNVRSQNPISSLTEAQTALNGVGVQSEATEITPVVNFWDPEGEGDLGNYGDTSRFPNDTANDDDHFAIRATGTVLIPVTSTWTFGINSDDGARLLIDGQTVIDDDSIHLPENRFAQLELSAGLHSIELIYFERDAGAEVELYAALGAFSTFNSNLFSLVGDVENGGLTVQTVATADTIVDTGFGSKIQTSTLGEMYGSTSSVYSRTEFTAPPNLDQLTLRVRYDDGFIAYLNGTEVARRNVAADALFDATATTNRSESDALQIENVDLSTYLDLLNLGGTNILALHALNDAIDSGEFLNVVELVAMEVSDSASGFFTSPTPGDFNSDSGVVGFLTDEIEWSHPHGFYDAPFSLSINSVSPGVNVRYTLDGSEPTESNGISYQGPIFVGSTSTIRAAAFQNEFGRSNVATSTFLFLDDIVSQSSDGSAPAGFPNGDRINRQRLDYGMDPDIVNDPVWGSQLKAALKQVPSISVVMDIDDLLGEQDGIYVHADQHGRAWERPISMELLDPSGERGFNVDAGIRIRGAFSRNRSNPKHAFRFFFRDEYGDASLDFPLFGDEGASSFDKIDLRSSQNYSWAFRGDIRNAYVRDVFSRDMQGLMGQPYTRSRFYHLYLNGQYWGLFQSQERSEANYAASYFGGDPDDFDVVKSAGSPGGNANEATDGNMAAYQRLAAYFYQTDGLSDANLSDYWQVQGMNGDGSRNLSFERLLDVDNLIDYMIVTYYTSDVDGPGSKFHRPRVNNYYAIYNRSNPDGFKFFEHDSEHSLDTGDAKDANFNMVTPLTDGGADFEYFNPHWMHERLAETNSEYRTRFADRVYEVMFNGGLFTAENAKSVIDARTAEFDLAIIAESARWGDAKTEIAYTKNDWQNAVDAVKTFIDGRVPVVIEQLNGQGWFPTTNAARFAVNGTLLDSGRIDPGDSISLVDDELNPLVGDVYYTINGSDPRDSGGGIDASAIRYNGNPLSLSTTSVIQTRVNNKGEWSPLAKANFQFDRAAKAGDLVVTEINYNPHDALVQFGEPDVDNNEFEFVELKNVSSHRIDLSGVQFVLADNAGSPAGIQFPFAVQTLDAGETITVVKNRAAFLSRYGHGARLAEREQTAVGAGTFDGSLSNRGEQLTLVDVNGEVIQQFAFSDAGDWPQRADGMGSTLEVADAANRSNSPENWLPSETFGGTPGADRPVFSASIVINEIMTHTDLPAVDAIELHNVSTQPVDISGWYVSDQGSNYLRYQFSVGQPIVIPAGGHLSIEQNELGFGFNGQEADDAWLIESDAIGRPWRFADHVEFGATQNGTTLGRWPNGEGLLFPMSSSTLGAINSGPLVGDLVVSEIHYDPLDPGIVGLSADDLEFVELWNRSNSEIELTGWRLKEAIDFTFPAGMTLGANERTTVVAFDPNSQRAKAAAFRTHFGMDQGLPLLGPASGDLANRGDRLELERPEDLANVGLGYVLVDRIVYESAPPWPTLVDGQNESLNRNSGESFGNFGTSWHAAEPTPGASRPIDVQSPPTANDDAYSISEAGVLQIAAAGILENDTDPNGDALSVSILQMPDHGTLNLSANGSFTYEHDGSETTSDRFTYTLDDGHGGQSIGTVSLTILPVNDPPMANDDFYSVQSGGTLTVNAPGVAANDIDVDTVRLRIDPISGPSHGTLELNSDGSFEYTHDGGAATVDSFDYRAGDGGGVPAMATVSIQITRTQMLGDFDADGLVGESDISILCQAINGGSQDASFDTNEDGGVDLLDFDFLIQSVLQTNFGDASLDGIFDSDDLIAIFVAGEYSDGIEGNSTWSEGDWDCDGDFESGDLVAAFAAGAYAAEARSNDIAAAVLANHSKDLSFSQRRSSSAGRNRRA